jgi:hypothetical protein
MKMMLATSEFVESYIRPWYNSANFSGPSKGTLYTQLVIMLKHFFFFILKMNTTLFQIYLKFIWPKRQCERKHTFFIS